MMITILNDIVNDIQLKLDKKDTNKCEEYRKQINKQFGVNIDSEPCKVIKKYENNTEILLKIHILRKGDTTK